MIASIKQRLRRRRGQATVEYAMLFVGVIMPFTFGLISLAQLLWTWHTAVEFTRMGARYATTHCWQAGGANVRQWMRGNVPAVLDSDMLLNGPAEIDISFAKKNADTGVWEDFVCDRECSVNCIPDVVFVRIRNYEFRKFLNYLGLPPITMPEFSASMPIESAGCDPDQGVCLP
ncbi:MAG: pilus assembly protein [Bryobacterales bacterium]|nr:pilus assembly protein [Bryobacterales bacterium]